ncbi:3-galactosyl-N-acetylglucosaminide 4-alpha-L-fucosyltransferase FUT3 [Bombina bombina]|uniref:3-galactosyl-N-acetylglucosaminide 4-alpha-L-fucosyltransferase FUT3 n=1 Tax=Bombina bombina TaxID=8345 RepID=UPI00235ACAE6|nr:3-galactosyl-N-acetylglucosaminide 4-alpha-L-fucosyltransferase FUT3 [Bombina bombina]
MNLKNIHMRHFIIFSLIFTLLFLISFIGKRNHILQVIFTNQTTDATKEAMKPNSANQSVCQQNSGKELLILVWVWPFDQPFPLDRCEKDFNITGCKLTADRGLYDTADAVIMHYAEIIGNRNTLPQKPRHRFQRWVWFNVEPPFIATKLHDLDNLFNMTMTFRKDSDIFVPYGHMQILKEIQNFTIPPKSKLVSWAVSKWYPGVPRIAYYNELKKYIQIDIYGKGNKPLNSKDFTKTISQYKFYLAFENSIYTDYITEKIWTNAFDSWAVPVVLGTPRKNYEQFIPGDAFIHVDDFSSHKELADYLLMLDKDDEKYKKYFNWRSYYKPILHTGWPILHNGWPYYYCTACRVLKNAPEYQVIPSIEKWYLEQS